MISHVCVCVCVFTVKLLVHPLSPSDVHTPAGFYFLLLWQNPKLTTQPLERLWLVNERWCTVQLELPSWVCAHCQEMCCLLGCEFVSGFFPLFHIPSKSHETKTSELGGLNWEGPIMWPGSQKQNANLACKQTALLSKTNEQKKKKKKETWHYYLCFTADN